MYASAILLRWYKSFNINYLGYDDRQASVLLRPWNSLSSPSSTAYRFIEIPLKQDITTIVGANESGKSHLLSALRKVVTGIGVPEGDGRASEFNVTDLCHYASIKNKNATGWPNVGATFEGLTPPDLSKLVQLFGAQSAGPEFSSITLVLAHSDKYEAVLYFGREESSAKYLSKAQLVEVRALLPRVEFINSNVPLASELPIDDLLAQSDGTKDGYVGFELAQQAASLVKSLIFGAENKADATAVSAIDALKKQLSETPKSEKNNSLELKLFNDVIGVDGPTLELLAKTKKEHRGFAEGLVATWNTELERKLNLQRFWQQDDQFSLSLNFKGGWFYFEIRDKTGAVYTFRERSSGLRYFLSYYIQAKSIESRYKGKNCIILMDEPDSFLSIAGQKNLLAVFESLVSANQGNQNLQLIYTTHSPFLINPNYPHRVRLVKKGDAEEGSQYIPESRLRRYEPVRSALGIDCAQTLFMGESNILVEGPSDQYAIAELIRLFTRLRNQAPILDLSSITLMSADSASGVAKVLDASKWGDERIPATVVLFDSDDEGKTQKDRVTGKAKRATKLIDEKFVVQIGNAVTPSDQQQIVTTEDLLPTKVFCDAVREYIARWYPEVFEAKQAEIEKELTDANFGKSGNAMSTQALFSQIVFGSARDYDKMGVLQIAIEEMEVSFLSEKDIPQVDEIERRLVQLLQDLRRKVEQSKQESHRDSARQAIVRTSDDFFKRFKMETEAFEIELHLDRLHREIESIGGDAQSLMKMIAAMEKEIKELRSSGDAIIKGEAWRRWSSLLHAVKKNPLAPEVHFDGDRVVPNHLWNPDKTSNADNSESVEANLVKPLPVPQKAEQNAAIGIEGSDNSALTVSPPTLPT